MSPWDSPACKTLRPLLTSWVPYSIRKCAIENHAHFCHLFKSISWYCVLLSKSNMIWSTCWGRDKMATILMLTFSNSVSGMKILLVWNFTEICSQWPNWQYINVSRYMIAWSGKGDKPLLNQWWPILLMHEFRNAYLTCKELLLVHCTSNFAWNTHPLNVLYNATRVFKSLLLSVQSCAAIIR